MESKGYKEIVNIVNPEWINKKLSQLSGKKTEAIDIVNSHTGIAKTTLTDMSNGKNRTPLNSTRVILYLYFFIKENL